MLLDGMELAELMINFGGDVTPVAAYEIKRIDGSIVPTQFRVLG